MKRVLILEDNKETLQYLERLIKTVDSDLEVLTFLNLSGAYEAILNTHIDLFLIDVIINTNIQGDTSGLVFADRLRTIRRYEFTPIIFVTSLEDPRMYTFVKLHGFGYIEKPFDSDVLIRLVKKALHFPCVETRERILHFRRDGLIFSINCDEIIYIKTMNHKHYFYMTGNREEVVLCKTLKQILYEADSPDLVQISRNTIVNRKYIENIDLVNMYVKIKGIKKSLSIGITYKGKIAKEFKDVRETLYID